MTNNKKLDPAVLASQLIAIEFITDLLATTDINEMSQKLTEYVHELIGARTVMLLVVNSDNNSMKMMNACPTRRSTLFSQDELNCFLPNCKAWDLPHNTVLIADEHPLKEVLLKVKIDSLLCFPLLAAGEIIGILILLGIPSTNRVQEIKEIVSHISTPIGFAIKNSLVHQRIEEQALEMTLLSENLESIVRDKTRELERTNETLNKSRLAALNLMQDAVEARKKAELITVDLQKEIQERKLVEEQIQESLLEKETLLRELYHRTKNNMQNISSLLQLQMNQSENPEVSEIVKDAISRINSMSLVQTKLYQSKNLSKINLAEYVEDLVNLTITNYIYIKDKIIAIFDMESFDVLIDTVMPFGLVLNELLTNTLKHAFPGDRKGVISISLKKNETNIVTFIYSDNGIGLPQDFDLKASNSLGLSLIKNIGENQMEGNFEIMETEGLTYKIVFNIALYKDRLAKK